jgi:hypothetical protein
MELHELDAIVAAILAAGSAAGRREGASGAPDIMVKAYRSVLDELQKTGGALGPMRPAQG